MDAYRYLLDLAIILLSTKVLGLLTKKVQMPQVVGALLAGLILGPAGFGLLTETSFIHEVAEIGVIVLMFSAGMETDIKELKASGKASFIIAFVFCLIMAFVAEEVFGVADITGAYIAGLIISNVQRSTYLESKFDTMSYLLLSPVFFASIGLKVELPKMSMTIIAFAVVLTIVAVITKIIGCGLGAKVCGYKNYQVKRIGVGMISRGEVALIVASKGAALGLMSSALLGPIIVVVVITTIITPVMLKVVFAPGTAPAAEQIVPESERVKSYYENREDNR